MKTYILRDPETVELQDPLRSEPGIVAITDKIVGLGMAIMAVRL